MGTDGEWVGDGKRVGCGRKGSGMGAEGEWAGNGRCVGWGWAGGGLGEEGKWVGENGRHVRGRSILS